MRIFSIILILFFAILGIVDIMKFILLKIFKKEKTKISTPNEAEFIIRSLGVCHSWDSKYSKSQLICLDFSESKETQKIIDIASKKFNFIEFKKIS
ncbi:MAG: hypothetical protein LBK29_03125 [Oscillospiraceae bacterium]|nr:hypothetical protein [Oscillospiraceae bacterium]